MVAINLLPTGVGFLACITGVWSSRLSFNERDYHPKDVIVKDFIVLGGGPSGTYAAVRLTDHHRSVVVIEKKNRLGGCTHTYIDPASGNTTDTGVYSYDNLTEVRNFFGRFHIPLATASFKVIPSVYLNFLNGKKTSAPAQPSSASITAWFSSLARFPYLNEGFFLPDAVPEDLLLPLGTYLSKYGLDDLAYFLFQNAPCQGNILDQTTLYVVKYFGMVNSASITNGYLTTERQNNSELYSAARAYLGSDVLLESTIVGLRRTASSVTAVVSTPKGKKLIKAKKLISSISPQLETGNLAGWDLSLHEKHIFGQFNSSAYYTTLVSNTGLNDSVVWSNADSGQVKQLPRLPQAYIVYPTVTIDGVFHVYYGSPYWRSEDEVKQDIVKEVQRVQALAGVPVTKPTFLMFDSHVPFQCTVSPKAIRKGFYKDLYGLQGHLSTFWTGAAFHTHDSSLLWQRTEKLLPDWLS